MWRWFYDDISCSFKNIDENERFYFVHSYHASEVEKKYVCATSNYPEKFPCAIKWKNIVAVQFHPEKSQHAGLQLLKNFLNQQLQMQPFIPVICQEIKSIVLQVIDINEMCTGRL